MIFFIDGCEVSEEELVSTLRNREYHEAICPKPVRCCLPRDHKGDCGVAPPSAREVGEAMASYLNSRACMALFAKVLLYKACGESPKVKVTFRSLRFRVSIERENGSVEHFNRDGEA
jgi:hypothetical protein